MTRSSTYLTSALLLATSLAFGCGSSDGGGPSIDSQLLGVYLISGFQGNTLSCNDPTDIEPAPRRLVLYSFLPNDEMDEPRLGGAFCGTVEGCRTVAAEAIEPPLGYSFIQGNDEAGWRGWAIPSGGPENDQCRANVQAHVLTSADGAEINIETRTFETVFPGIPPTDGGTQLTCRNIDALASLNDEPPPPCAEILVLDATFEAGL